MIASVSPLSGAQRCSNVRVKVWLNVSGWPHSAFCGRLMLAALRGYAPLETCGQGWGLRSGVGPVIRST
jgi:hypothetical protein